MIDNIFIINSSGSMMYAYQKKESHSTNKLLMLCSTLHSINSIISEVEGENFKPVFIFYKSRTVSYYKTPSSTSFVFVSEKKVTDAFVKVYEDYSKYVLMNPFYNLEMPIHCEKFKPYRHFVN